MSEFLVYVSNIIESGGSVIAIITQQVWHDKDPPYFFWGAI